MQYPNVLVIGGAGFIGQTIVSRLVSAHHNVVVPSRRRRDGRELFLLPTVSVTQTDIHSIELEPLIAAADAVINLVGVLHSAPPKDTKAWGPDFDLNHVQLPSRIAAACARGGQRLIHFSALGADPDNERLPSAYQKSKAAGETAIATSDCHNWTILRPSIVFGPNDSFLNMFASLQRFFPVMALGRARAQMQPIFVGDVASAVMNILSNQQTFGKTYELAGPEIFTLAELVRLSGRLTGNERKIIELPDNLGELQAKVLGMMPGPTLMSHDNFLSLGKPNIATGPLAPELGIKPQSLLSLAPTWLSERVSPFNEKRARARR